jgi:hypothetical protein
MKATWMRPLGVFLFAAIMAGAPAVAQETGQAPETQAPSGQPPAQTAPPYQPKFPGDPARSDSEAQALGYMRVVLRAQREYKKRHDKFAPSLAALAGTGSLTKRMAATTDRGDYTVGFHAEKDGFVLVMTPKAMDAQHRSFYAEDDGVIRGDDTKAADQNSPKVK